MREGLLQHHAGVACRSVEVAGGPALRRDLSHLPRDVDRIVPYWLGGLVRHVRKPSRVMGGLPGIAVQLRVSLVLATGIRKIRTRVVP